MPLFARFLPRARMRDEGVTRRRVEVDGTPTAWAERPADGPPSAPPLVLVPGLSMSWRAYRWMLPHLPSDRLVLAVDPPAAGRSGRPGERLDATAQAAHLAAWLERLGHRGVDLVGHSLGALTVARLAGTRPDLARRLVLVGPSPDAHLPRVRDHLLALACDALRERPRVILQAVTDYVRADPALLAAFAAQVGTPADEVMHAVRAPVVVVRGGRDGVAGRRWCQDLAGAVADGRVLTLPRGTHGLPQHDPADLAAVVRAVLG
ncbi:alpha/beta fold hydrolase [Janibacter melonis]|uniref:alpha/beta fold hydrolase n=1 Tax=Janibacter melonis TaxID=262209 RepID=UPI002043B110|nr:alpha/beta hydrolase family protein [Janibacter melonis]MCM3554596.1 alpha/beta fold hydrolase [Janibacter melonis]